MRAKENRIKVYIVVTNYYLSLCNSYKQRAFSNTTVEWE